MPFVKSFIDSGSSGKYPFKAQIAYQRRQGRFLTGILVFILAGRQPDAMDKSNEARTLGSFLKLDYQDTGGQQPATSD
jgi:hypothetical protein